MNLMKCKEILTLYDINERLSALYISKNQKSEGRNYHFTNNIRNALELL